MKWLITGSVAQYHWFEDSRKPKDIDLLTPAKICGNDPLVCVIDAKWHELADEIILRNNDPVFVDPNMLFTLKVSHAHWDIFWNKTMFDITFLKEKGCHIHEDLYHKLVKMWTGIHGEKRANLNVTVEEFFSDAVNRKYDHDFIHECVAFNDRPMHELIRPDLSKAWCSEELFNALSEEQRAQTALEEMMATAIERRNLDVRSSKLVRYAALLHAHKQLCTSMTKGWFARYLIINHHDLIHKRKSQWQNQLTIALDKINQ